MVMRNGAESTPAAVALIETSFTEELNADPELVMVVVVPEVVERLTSLDPAVTVQVVGEPPLDVKTIETS